MMQTQLRKKIFGCEWWYREAEKRKISARMKNLHVYELLVHEEERFGIPKARELGKAEAIRKRKKEVDKAKELSKTKREKRFDSHGCIADEIAEDIEREIKSNDYELQREVFRKKHGFSPSKHVMRMRKKFKKRRKQHHSFPTARSAR